MWPTSVLMVSPDFFNVEYQINPHMVDQNGNLNQIDQGKAMHQWLHLKSTFENINIAVDLVDGKAELPDMVFCANQTLPFMKDGVKSVILSQMQSEQRMKEVEFLSIWAKSKNWKTYALENGPFEGSGDALWNYEAGKIFGGYGFRTSIKAYQEIENITGAPCITLELKDERFYHLDTCLSILGESCAAYVPEAFTESGIQTLKDHFSHLIPLPLSEALDHFAANCCTPNGKDVIMQSGATQSAEALKDAGFRVHQVDTSEFIKAGGSVFCMKQMLF